MAVKILIKRVVPSNRETGVMPFLRQIRPLASMEPGYISGETLRNDNDPSDYLVISTWKTIEDWERWVRNIERKGIHDRIDSLLASKPVISSYHYK